MGMIEIKCDDVAFCFAFRSYIKDAGIGIGTDCANEERRLAQAGRKPEPAAPQASARLAISTTAVSAVQADGQRRAVVQGGPVYPGDLLETGGQGHAI